MPVYSQQTFYFSTFLFMLPYFKDVSLSIISMQFHSFFSLFASCHFTPNKLYISLNLYVPLFPRCFTLYQRNPISFFLLSPLFSSCCCIPYKLYMPLSLSLSMLPYSQGVTLYQHLTFSFCSISSSCSYTPHQHCISLVTLLLFHVLSFSISS